MSRILVIEDDLQMRAVLRQMLERAGYDVEEASNGRVGVSIHRDNPADLVITDLIMPDQEGLETIRELTRDFSDIKIIVISGGGNKVSGPFLSIALELGAHRAFGKPFEMKELLDSVRELLEE